MDSDDEIERMQLQQMQQSSAPQRPSPPDPLQQQKLLNQTSSWLKIYPVYFDADKSRAEGRRVSRSICMSDPSSIYLCEAISLLGLQIVYENEKVDTCFLSYHTSVIPEIHFCLEGVG